MTAKTIMVQGTSSGVGKSLVAMALCRHFKRKGFKTSPFKSQNMSLNSAVSVEGGEMARSQYIQAIAAGAAPSVKMNPILLKPETGGSQIILMGKVFDQVTAKDYMMSKKIKLFETSLASLNELIELNDVVVIEGAGSPAEINLKKKDIVNMKIAKAIKAPVILVVDIERGGAFAQIVGTMELLDDEEKELVIGYMFNKFVGDPSLLDDYPKRIAKRYGIEFLGTMPKLEHKIPEEDSMFSWHSQKKGDVNIDIVKLPHISNFDDFDVLRWNENVRFVENDLKGDLIIIPGTKETIEDLRWLKKRGIFERILEAKREGTTIMGICGGYQILGRTLKDVKSGKKEEGFGFLPVETTFNEEKKNTNVLKGIENLFGTTIEGYEIHQGITTYLEDVKPFSFVNSVNGEKISYEEGVITENVLGTYFHGLFKNVDFTENLLNSIRSKKGISSKPVKMWSLTDEINKFTDTFEKHVNIVFIERKMGI